MQLVDALTLYHILMSFHTLLDFVIEDAKINHNIKEEKEEENHAEFKECRKNMM